MNASAAHRSIIVGFDGSPASSAALEFAFVEAIDRAAPVTVMTTWMPGLPAPVYASELFSTDVAPAMRSLQDNAIRTILADLGERPAYTQVVRNDVCGPALVEAARDAALLVVGTGRKDALARTFLGSVSDFCVRHSSVPVVVVPAPSGPTALQGSASRRRILT